MYKDKSSIFSKFLIDLSNYEVIKKINSGGFGDVYTIQNKNTEQKYAAKILSSGEESEQDKKLINREIGIMIRIQHPTIIHFHGFSLHDFNGEDNVTIIMDFAQNGSLYTLLQNVRKGLANKDYDNTARQKILVGVAYGMMHLHKNHIIHRDLKPGNILLDEYLNPHITDFGLSKIIMNGRSQSQTQSYGTSIYMAPEVIKGNKYNEKADVYSFSILMYEVVTDSIPYPLFQSNKMSLFQFNEQVVHKNYRPEFTIPIKEALKKLIIQCWSENPSERPSFEEIFNMLAFNFEGTVHDIFEGENEVKFYLDDVDIDEVLNYAYQISENEGGSSEILIDQLKKENEKIRETMEKQSELIKKLASDNDKLKSDNESIMKRLTILEQKIVLNTNVEDNKSKTTEKPLEAPKLENILDFQYTESHELDGIINYLTGKTGGNIHDNGTIEVTCNSMHNLAYHPKNLLDLSGGLDFQAGSVLTNIWICFDFKNIEIEMSSYTIKSAIFSKDKIHFKSWCIQISNDKKNWETIDTHSNSSELNGPNIIRNFKVSPNHFVRYCRLTCDDWWSKECYDLEFSSIEFFGRLKLPK